MPISQSRLISLIQEYETLWEEYDKMIEMVKFAMRSNKNNLETMEATVWSVLNEMQPRKSGVVLAEQMYFTRFAKSNDTQRERQKRRRLGLELAKPKEDPYSYEALQRQAQEAKKALGFEEEGEEGGGKNKNSALVGLPSRGQTDKVIAATFPPEGKYVDDHQERELDINDIMGDD